jgi:hypothetical protein
VYNQIQIREKAPAKLLTNRSSGFKLCETVPQKFSQAAEWPAELRLDGESFSAVAGLADGRRRSAEKSPHCGIESPRANAVEALVEFGPSAVANPRDDEVWGRQVLRIAGALAVYDH